MEEQNKEGNKLVDHSKYITWLTTWDVPHLE